ncbi:MAG: hypothetical protein ACJ8AT_39285 [Hyalangium sp.]|uniref:hypothetical protein n=1 Tax=Hyalangium sp. TaxID=2028555 RepID=UPI00389ACD8C
MSVPVHYGTFILGDDGQGEAVTDLHSALKALPEPRPEFWVLGFDEGRDVP